MDTSIFDLVGAAMDFVDKRNVDAHTPSLELGPIVNFPLLGVAPTSGKKP
jgi:hypothetical protein